MTDYPRTVMDAFAASAAAAAEKAAIINKEILDFGQQRFEADAGTAEAMLAAESLSDMLALQRDFMMSTFESYAKETARLRELAMEMTDEMVGRLSKPIATKASAA
ncbi:phasin family protein [Parvibaculum sp.]|uniref:phasin family protein n=1 Tax=Parvibaculum sp. TaxID=2024848 RepID=UPI002731F9D6|nr:phasin family protein [Parvibaculum sp.]MDP1626086.1 phasin family protein [Parvibaculum sp.]MDP2151403.1 phasin family protein [Parvibaculum sp.]MDP3329267.1 phasin family protein [Parvibaculum sp.]